MSDETRPASTSSAAAPADAPVAAAAAEADAATRPPSASTAAATSPTNAARASVSADSAGAGADAATRPPSASIAGAAAAAEAAPADGSRGSVAGRAASPSNAGRAASPSNAGATAAAAANGEEKTRGSTINADAANARPAGASVSGDAARPASGSVAAAANGNGNGTERAATQQRASTQQQPERAATQTPAPAERAPTQQQVQAERAPTQQQQQEPVRASVSSKSSPVPADQKQAEPAVVTSTTTNSDPSKPDLSKAVTAGNGGGTAQTNAALADRAEKKNQLSGGDKDITKPRPIEDVKRELAEGTKRCTEAWSGHADAFAALKVEDPSVKYMGFVLVDGDQKAALFHVDGAKTGPAAATAKPDDKAFRLLRLSDLTDSKEEVKLMYTASPIVLASAAGKGGVVKALVERFGVDPQHPQTIYTAKYDDEKQKWVVDNSQGRRVNAGEVALANGFEDVAATGGCRMCAGGDCTLM